MRLQVGNARSLLLTVCMACTGPHMEAHGRPAEQPAAVRQFNERAGQYVALHRRIEIALPPFKEVSDPAKVAARQKALATAIRKARPDARQGEIFTDTVVSHFRSLVKSDLKTREPAEVEAVLDEVPKVTLRPNDDYPEDEPLATVPPMLLAALPQLPEELEYRFVGRDLILRDVKANLIVDFIPGILARPQ